MQTLKARFVSGRYVPNTTYLPLQKYILHTAYEHEGRYPDKLVWLDTYLDPPEFNSIDRILDDSPDIICFSMYVWTAPYMVKIAKYLRDRAPDAVFIAGGADVRHQTHEQYMQDHPWFDYVIYGAGEEAFVKLVDLVLEKRTRELDLLNVPNLIFRNKQGQAVKTKHQVYKGKIFSELSPYILQQTEVRKDANYIRAVCNSNVYAAWEPDRGCPYHCSFCDWGYGLHNKVIRKKFSFEQELDLFKQLDATIMITAANIGMFPDDIRYMEYLYQHDIKHLEPSWAKNHKKQVAEIWRKQIDITGELKAFVSLESINDQVLNNIDRPCMPWKEMKELLLEFRRQGHKVEFYPEIIVGLPGETIDSWDHMMFEFMDMFPLYHIRQYEWLVLPNSPSGSIEYQTKHQLDVRKTRIPYSSTSFEDQSLDQVLVALSQDHDDFFSAMQDVAWGSYSNGVIEKLYFIIAAGITSGLSIRYSNNISVAKKIYQSLKPKMLSRATQDAEIFSRYFERTGCMTSFVFEHGKLYNYVLYWGRPDSIQALTTIKT